MRYNKPLLADSRDRQRRDHCESKTQEVVLVFLETPYGVTPGVSLSIISEAAWGDDGHRAVAPGRAGEPQ